MPDTQLMNGFHTGLKAAVAACLALAACVVSAAGDADFSAVCDSISEAALRKHIEALAACGSRVPGYPGHDRAAEYIRLVFAEIGLTRIEQDRFPVAVPVDEGSSLEIAESGERFTLHALWPNVVRTSHLPPEGVSGTAIDGGSGEWQEFNGKVIEGNVVFLDFNSHSLWLNAAMLGARAVVFVEPDRTVRRQAEAKLADVPLNMPRFWISREDYARFASEGMGKQVRVRCRMPWRQVEGINLMGRIEGSDAVQRDKLVCIQTYYDSMSVVPAVSPGAEAACGVAVMLELARVLKADPPGCSVLFLATSGHHLGRCGIFDFVHRHSRRRSPFCDQLDKPIYPDLLLSLDLTSRNNTVGVAFQSAADRFPEAYLYKREFRRHANLLCGYAEGLGSVLGIDADELCMNLVQPEGGGSWRAYLPEYIHLDGGVALMAATPAVCLVTANDPRVAFDTPLDRAPNVVLPNLAIQTRFLACAFLMGLNDPELLEAPKMGQDYLRRFRGRLVIFDPTKSFMPDEPVCGAVGHLLSGSTDKLAPNAGTNIGVRRHHLGIADADGWFEVFNVGGKAVEYTVQGFALDPASGDIVKAIDLGLEGAAQYPVDFNFDTYLKERTAVLFDCTATDLYDLVDPRYLIPMDKLSLFDPGNAQPFAYGYVLSKAYQRGSEAAPYATLFSRPGTPMKVGVSSDILGLRMLFLNAPSADGRREEAEGLGYSMEDHRLVVNAPYQVLRDMYHLDEFRIRMVKEFGIDNRRLERLHAAAGDSLQKAGHALQELRWDSFVRHARRGLGIESRAYPDVRATSDDVVKGIVFYMALLLPFAFFCERLFFAFSDLKRRIAAFVGFFVLSYIVLRLVHPAFRIVETSEVILLGLVILALCTIVVSISSRRFEAQMRSLKQRRARVHDTDVSRADAVSTAFALGVSNMRRRKVRTFLTCTAVVLLMFTVLSFTSVQTYLRPRKLPRSNKPAYQGALVRDRAWVPMKYLALEHLQSEFGRMGTLARRSWLMPRQLSQDFTQLSILVRSVTEGEAPEGRIRAFGLVGFDPVETEVSGVHTTLKSGRWFQAGERDVCIITEGMAESLGIGTVDVGAAQVNLLGLDAAVIGIVDDDLYNGFRDLDNERLTPLDFTMLSRQALSRARGSETDVSQIEGRAPLETFVHLDARNTVLLPYETVLDLGGVVSSVAVAFDKGSVSDHVSRFLDRMAVTVFVGEGDRVMVYSSLASSSVGGMGNVLVPILIAALMVLNTMSGSVHERLREIGTYSSVGLAPIHIGALFLAEACVYAILGGIAGYVIGQVVTRALFAVGALRGLTLNYSSLASVLASVVVMATVVLSTLYPARMASRLAVPDVTRRWVLPDPTGDEWTFDFPFTVGGKEVAGLFVFFRYYFASFEEQSVGRFYTADNEVSMFEESGQKGYRLAMKVWLSPYDLGVSQHTEMRAVPAGDFGVYEIQLRIRRLSGQATTWVRINRGFLNEVRKQFLLWRTIRPEGKEEYFAEAEEAFELGAGSAEHGGA